MNMMSVSACAQSTGAMVYGCVDALATRGFDGQPYGLHALDGVSKVIKGMEWASPVAAGLVTVNAALKPAATLIGCLTAPLAEFPSVCKAVRSAMEAVQGRCESKKHMIVNLVDTSAQSASKEAEAPVPFKVVKEIVTEHKANNEKAALAILATATLVADYVENVANATSKVCELGAAQLSSSLLTRISLIGAAAASIFMVLGSLGNLYRFTVASVKLLSADVAKLKESDLESLRLSFKQAAASLAKTAIKIALLVFAMQFSLVVQGFAALAVVGINIYLAKTKDAAVPKEEETYYVEKLAPAVGPDVTETTAVDQVIGSDY